MTAAVETTVPVVEQLALPIADVKHPEGASRMTIQDRFEAFHALNPWVLDQLERMTAIYLETGRPRISIKMLVEVLRWNYGRATTGAAFQLDNDLSSRYVRLIVERHPEWASAFRLRALKAV